MANDSKHTGLKVVGAGLPRSSTLSLKTALEQLGFGPCYHVMTHVLVFAPYNTDLWIKICKEENKQERQRLLRSMYEGSSRYPDARSAVDGPTCFFVDDFMEMYPDCKFVLGVRDNPEAWHTSFMGSVGRAFGRPMLYWMVYWQPSFLAMFHFNDGWNDLVKKRYGVDARSVELYDRHVEWVKKTVPSDRLLVHNAKQGWGPLCRFLQVPEPDNPYPRVNDIKSIQKLVNKNLRSALLRWALLITSVGVAAGALYSYS